MDFGGLLKVREASNLHKKKLVEFKRLILERLTFEQVKEMADFFGVSAKKDEIESLISKAVAGQELPIDRKDYIRALMGGASGDEIINYCDSKNLRDVDSIIKGRKEYLVSNGIDASGKPLA